MFLIAITWMSNRFAVASIAWRWQMDGNNRSEYWYWQE